MRDTSDVKLLYGAAAAFGVAGSIGWGTSGHFLFAFATMLIAILNGGMFLRTTLPQLKAPSLPKALKKKSEDVEPDPYDLKGFLDYRFLAELEHELDYPHCSHSLRSCEYSECLNWVRELDAIENGEEKPKAPKRRNVFEEVVEQASYHEQAAKLIQNLTANEARECGYPSSATIEVMNYPEFDQLLAQQVPAGTVVYNVWDGAGSIINQIIETPDETFGSRASWNTHYERQTRSAQAEQRRRAQSKKREEEKLKLQESMIDKINDAASVIVLEESMTITPIGDPDILEPEARVDFKKALEAMKSYNFGLKDEELY